MAKRDQGSLKRASTKGPTLYQYSARPDAPGATPKAVIAVVHGYGEYGARYAHVMGAWADRGIASVAIDLRGHGRAGGRRGFCDRFDDFTDDVKELERLATAEELPTFLFGHSFGGLVALSSALARPAPWRAIVLSAPFLGLALEVSPIKRLAGKIASRLVPGFALPSGIRSSDVTHDAARAAAYDLDPLIFHIATARWFTETQAAQKHVFAQAGTLTKSLYVAMGTEDRIAAYGKARAFFDAAGAHDKVWDKKEGLFHEVLNEPDWRTVADAMADFVLARL
jgi:acylglycerol lipase